MSWERRISSALSVVQAETSTQDSANRSSSRARSRALTAGMLATGATAAFFGLGNGALAATSSSSDTTVLEEVVVTGSRIATPELESMTPVTIVNTQAIEASGALNISEYLRDLPSVGTSTLSGTNSNFLTNDSGVNTINLRNLGDQRTLVSSMASATYPASRAVPSSTSIRFRRTSSIASKSPRAAPRQCTVRTPSPGS